MSNYKRKIWNERNSSDGINHRVESGELVHYVDIKEDSFLYSIIKESHFMVNSLHNFHALSNDYYDIVGYSEDGLIEAIEYSKNTFNIGVQWHPEKNYTTCITSRRLIESFVNYALKYKASIKLHMQFN